MRETIHPLGLAVLLALAPTAYAADTQDIEKGKEQVKEAGVFIGQQIEVIDKNSRYGDMPADNAAAGLAAAEDLNNKYIREIKIGETLFGDKMPGAVTATFYNDEPTIPELRGKKISIMPINSRYQSCASNIESLYFPKEMSVCAYITNKKELKAYNDHILIKDQAAEMHKLVSGLRADVTETRGNKGAWPENNKTSGLAEPFDIRGKYVKEVRVGVNLSGDKQPGVITATLYNEEPVAPELRGKKLSYVPSEKDGAYQWDCVSNIDSQYLPEPCRHVDK